jgi:hypothetical protein
MPVGLTARQGRTVVCACAFACAAAGCVLPSDQSDTVVVTVDAPSAVLLRGRTMVLTAHAWEKLETGALRELSGVPFQWRSLQPDLATIDPRADGTALITPLNEGVTKVEAVAVGLGEAAPGVVELRVVSALAIDSVRPSMVRYGEQVTIYGIGVDEITRASLGQADLVPDPLSFSGTPQGAGQLSYWVPYPAQTDRLVALSRGGSTAAAPEPTEVKTQDLYHELSLPPPRVDVDGRPARGPDTLFFNPAMAAVPGEGLDVFEFHQDQPGRTFTITLTSTGPVVTSFDPVLTAERNLPNVFPADDELETLTWALGFSGQYCGDEFLPTGRPVTPASPVTLVRALKEVPYEDLFLGVYGEPPGQYTVTVRNGYVTADPRIGADRFEENDFCAAADSNAVSVGRQVVLPFSDTLTIDNAYEVDWYRFTVPPQVPPGPLPDPSEPPDPDARDSLVTIRTAPRPFGASDSSNIGLILVPAFGITSIIADSRTPSSEETITALLSSGDYYLIVLDDGGVATRYSLCLGYGPTCPLFEEHAEGRQAALSNPAPRSRFRREDSKVSSRR